MIIQPDFLDHWKTRLLVETLNDPCAPLYLIRLWGHCQNRKTHRFPLGYFNMLKAICFAPHETSVFQKALVECGFIRIEGEELVAHDWDNINASLIANWENGKSGGRPSKKTRGFEQKNPSLTQTKPINNPTVTDREEKTDKIEEKKASSFEIKDILNSIPESRRVIFESWLAYKSERKEKYKPTGFKALVNKFKLISNEELSSMIDHSMAMNYAGIFPDRNKDAGKQIISKLAGAI